MTIHRWETKPNHYLVQIEQVSCTYQKSGNRIAEYKDGVLTFDKPIKGMNFPSQWSRLEALSRKLDGEDVSDYDPLFRKLYAVDIGSVRLLPPPSLELFDDVDDLPEQLTRFSFGKRSKD